MSVIPDGRPPWSVLSVVLTSLLVASCSGDAVAPISPNLPLPETALPTLAISADLFTVSPDGPYAFVGAEVSRELLIVDLVDGTVLRRAWLDELGPTTLDVIR